VLVALRVSLSYTHIDIRNAGMESDDNQYIVINEGEEEDLSFYPIDSVDISEDTECFFDGAWMSITESIDRAYPNTTVSDPMCTEDDDGFLGIWARVDCGHSAVWLRVMTLCATHWCWSDEECH